MAQLKNLIVTGPSSFIGDVHCLGNNKAFKIGNETYSAGLLMGSDGKTRGLYDFTLNKWMISANENGVISINGTATDALNATSSTKWSDKTYIKISDGTNSGTALGLDGSETATTAATAVSLLLPSKIKAELDGKANTAGKWHSAVNFNIASSDGTNAGSNVSVDGSGNVTLKLASTIKATLDGNATTATTATKLSSNAGGTKQPIYFANGIPTAITATVGGSTTPMYMNGGTLTAFNSTLGSSTKPIYMNGGALTACSYDVNVANTTENGKKLYLIGAELSGTANQTTYGKSILYADEFGALHSTSFTVDQKVNMKYNTTDECLEFVFA